MVPLENSDDPIAKQIADRINTGTLHIPPYPSVALKLRQILAHENYQLRDVVQCISTDQALSASVLAHANSAFYRGIEPIQSIDRAITRIGAEQLRRVALALTLGAQASSEGPLVELRRRVWQGSIVSALVCHALASRRSLDPSETFTCGLLHDFGKTVALGCIEDLVAQGPQKPMEYWDNVVEAVHVDAGVLVAKKWSLSGAIYDAIALHHGPVDPKLSPMLALVQLSDEVVTSLREHHPVDSDDPTWIQGVTDRTDRTVLAELLPRLGPEVSSFEFSAAGPPSMSRMSVRKLAIAAPATVCIPSEGRPANFVVRHLSKLATETYTAEAVSVDTLFVSGVKPLKVNCLARLELGCDPPLTLWFNVGRCRSDAGTFHVEAHPFALDGGSGRLWRALST
ncbi:MAG: HDOD domain-containing protein [Myxococcales bacterium]